MRCACALADAGIERTYNFKQEDILKHVEVGAAQKVFDLGLPDLGPYKVRRAEEPQGLPGKSAAMVGWAVLQWRANVSSWALSVCCARLQP